MNNASLHSSTLLAIVEFMRRIFSHKNNLREKEARYARIAQLVSREEGSLRQLNWHMTDGSMKRARVVKLMRGGYVLIEEVTLISSKLSILSLPRVDAVSL